MSRPRSLALPAAARAEPLPGLHGPLAAVTLRPARPTRLPVLLVPGFTGSKEDFLPLLEPLAAHGHVVAGIDQRGQHESPHAAAPEHYDARHLGLDALAVARRLGRRVHLVGHSFGGLVARAAAIVDPSAFASVTLLCSGPGGMAHAAADLRELVDALHAHEPAVVYDVMRARELADGDVVAPPEIEEFLRARWLATDPAHLRRLAEQLVEEADRTTELAATGLPLLVTHGVDDDAWPVEEQREMAARLGARYVVIPAAAHSPAVENPSATSGVLSAFFAEAEGLASGS